MSIQKATGKSPWKYRAAIVALCACAVSLHAQSTQKEQPEPSQSEATQKLQERVTQLESEVSELSALAQSFGRTARNHDLHRIPAGALELLADLNLIVRVNHRTGEGSPGGSDSSPIGRAHT